MIAAAITPRARQVPNAAARWIAKDNPVAAEALRHAVIRAAGRIGDHPNIGVRRPEPAPEPYRFPTPAGLPYVIVYNPAHAPPLTMRVLHGARDLPVALRGM